MKPKIGPRGITIQNVKDVATRGLPKTGTESDSLPYETGAATYASTSQPKPQAFNSQLLAAMMAGQPTSTYGEKYGGFPTQSMLNQAALGYALNWQDVADLAESQQQSLTVPLEAKLNQGLRSAQGYEDFAKEIAKSRAKDLENQNFFERMNPKTFLAQTQAAQNEAKRKAAVEKYATDFETQFTTDYDRQALPYEQVASAIRETPISQLARQALISQYGVDPNVARASFDEQTDIDYAKLQRESDLLAQGIDFSKTEAERVYDTFGLEVYNEWQQDKANEAIFGTPAQQEKARQDTIDAENLATDLVIEDTYGIRPSQISNVSPDTVRSIFSDPTFVETWIRPSLDRLSENDGLETGQEIAAQMAQEYLATNPNDLLRAKALAAIVAEFDFLAR